MLWYPVKQYGDFRLKLQFREGRTDGGSSNGGVFLRFPDARVPAAQRPDACARTGSAATQEAWVAIYCGHEFQLFDGIEPNSEPQKTGSVYNFDPNDINQIGQPKETGEWEDYEVEAVGQTFKIYRNGDADQQVRSTRRARPRAAAATPTRASASSRVATSASRTTAEPTRRSTATSAWRTSTPGATAPTRPGCSRSRATVSTRSSSARSTRPATSRSASRTTFEIGGLAPPTVERDAAAVAADRRRSSADDRHARVLPARHAAVRISRARFARRGLSVPVTCTGAMTGSATLTVSASDARQAQAEPPHDRRRRRALLGRAHGADHAQAVQGAGAAARAQGRSEEREADPVGADARLGQARHDRDADDHAQRR